MVTQSKNSGFVGSLKGRGIGALASALAGIGLVAGSLSAATVSYSTSKDMDFTNWATTLSVPQFDGALGTLLSVQVIVTGENNTQTMVENLNFDFVEFVTGSDVTITASGPTGPLVVVLPQVRFANVLGEYDGENDFGGASGVMNPLRSASDEESRTLVPGEAGFFDFVGTGNIPLNVVANARGFYQGPADYRFEVVTQAAATLTVVYQYEEPVEDEIILGSIGDRVWKDLNSDGVQDANEPGLKGWTVTLLKDNQVIGSQQTGDNGIYLFNDLPLGEYTVRVTPKSGYVQTYDLDGLLSLHVATAFLDLGETRLDVDFGYDCFWVCIPSGKGCTPGFWSNRNGQALIRPSDLAILTALNLVDRHGNPVDMMNPTTFNFGGVGPTSLSAGKTVLRNLLLNTSSVNMATQLSRHMAAFRLNVRWGFIRSTSTYRINGQTVTAMQLIELANQSLAQSPVTLSGHSQRAYQSCIKDIMDRANQCACR